jgi:uncharacterized protein
MSLVVLLLLFIAGLIVGFAAGLIGIGGGILIVPLLYFFYAHPAWSGTAIPGDIHTEVAHATSLFIIIPTALWGARSYSKAGLVVWRAAIPIAIASTLAAVAGVKLALILPSAIVRVAFGGFLLFTGIQLIWRPHLKPHDPHPLDATTIAVTGIAVGLLSGLMGVGGGAIAASLLIYFGGFALKEAAATSLAIVSLTAIVSALTYAAAGLNIEGMPPGSLGYIHVTAALPILVGSVLSVKTGTIANQRMANKTLKWIFSAFFTLLGLWLIVRNISAL